MPVVNLELKRLNKVFPGLTVEQLTKFLPYIGVDIEGFDDKILRIEYNPNRPDFSSEYGIARAFRGLLEIETGIPKYLIYDADEYSIITDPSVLQIRPYIVSLVAKGGELDSYNIKQLIAMQEDLHNGLGRHRVKASIGIHDLDHIKFPLTYTTVNDNFSFVPLDGGTNYTIREILGTTENGRQYGYILRNIERYPILKDANANILSFPPIINGSFTKINPTTKNLLIEVTANNIKTSEDILAIFAQLLYDAQYKIHTVQIKGNNGIMNSPNMNPFRIDLDRNFVNKMLGLNLTIREIIKCLNKCRLDVTVNDEKNITCIIPKYRIDIYHPIDIVEEVAIGYGIYNLQPSLPASTSVGQRDCFSRYFDNIRETMAGMGLIEVFEFSVW